MTTILYAALLAILYAILIVRVVRARYKHKIGLGDGGVPELVQCIRVHGNFAEHVPFALFLIFLVDYVHYASLVVHMLGIMLVVGRIMHIIGVTSSPNASVGRAVGTVLTFAVYLICAGLLLWHFFALRLTGF